MRPNHDWKIGKKLAYLQAKKYNKKAYAVHKFSLPLNEKLTTEKNIKTQYSENK